MNSPRFGEDPDWQSEGESDVYDTSLVEAKHIPIRLSRGKPKVTKEDLESESDTPTKQNAKTFFLPTMNEATFIDHGCTLDPQGYPLLPNGNTIFVRLPGESITNFGNVGFSKRTGSEYRSKGAWKLKRIYCLGVLSCDLPDCRWAGAPPTGRVDMSEWLEKNSNCPGAHGTCPGNVQHIECKNTLICVDEHVATSWAVLRHCGVHNHVWPEAKKPDQLSRETLKAEIAKNPKAGAFSLRIRKPNPSQDTYDSVLDIHPSLGNADRLRYYRKLMLKELNITPENLGGSVGDHFITDLFKWVKVFGFRRGLLIISSSYLEGEEHFTFQSEWMKKRLLARDIDHKVYGTGLVSDVTYRFFRNGYLLSTSMYCEELARWIPIQLTWIRGLAEKYYQVHFAVLFRQFLVPEFTDTERNILVCNIVDFSAAQREGFVAAYWEVFGICDKKVVLNKLQGCHEHYRAQVTRVKRNRHVVMADEESTFQKMCMDLIKEPVEGDTSHEDKIDSLRRRFPKAKRWLDWWTMADVESMLFPSRRPKLEDTPEGQERPTKTTNAQESLHRLYYMLSEGKTCLMLGMIQLYSFIKVLEEDFDAVMRGVSIEYGAARKGHTDIAQSLGWEKKRKRAPNPAKPVGDQKVRHNFVNDGRAPDTTDALLPELAKKKLGRPSGSRRCMLCTVLPLWHRGSSGTGTSLFTSLVKHFSARSTYELTKIGSIRGVLSKAQSSILTQAQNRSPKSFVEGEFASADLFIELALDPKANPNRGLKGLFEVEEKRILTCNVHPAATQHLTRLSNIINIRRQTFYDNNVDHANVTELLRQWNSVGLHGVCGLQCKFCVAAQDKAPQVFVRMASEVAMCQSTDTTYEDYRYKEHSTLGFPKSEAPPHLYFFLDVATISDEIEQQDFMATMNWPSTIFLSGQNDGYARLVTPDPSKLGGAAPHSSWLMYSRGWTGNEQNHVNEMMAKIKSDYPHATGHTPFASLSTLLNSFNTNEDAPTDALKKSPARSEIEVPGEQEVDNTLDATNQQNMKISQEGSAKAAKKLKIKIKMSAGSSGASLPPQEANKQESEAVRPAGRPRKDGAQTSNRVTRRARK
ncbi:uncharacterized protein PGTG_05792 [Puccinia graminis f. sp. tritici CRL 75-36-700-3]|uniref:Uncharacterized protein n=1 Tax=Puccinia graminis f. sp. tritici (strain CRL 75-36-700-3 / race SCCL) TaxID=418459 RepID=E3K5L4_PUCGT|nr:uncharacterized protein PGTG_05792 [Puccinia graminis f. sp. tritici CRL 75-36-700-3]EFP79471.2 hypothetical protein PGTG_05792 [Puccinia graminis f. sp. tritici CRL 75-36-700-3]